MNLKDKHIILVGFKQVGKSALAKGLAKKTHRKWIDLDEELLSSFNKGAKAISCRTIVQTKGENFFRSLETKTLIKTLNLRPSIIALGGGTLLSTVNQALIRNHVVVHITAPRNIVFEKIMIDGWLEGFDSDRDPYTLFNRLWEERKNTYKKVSQLTIVNNSSIDIVSKRIYSKLFSHGIKIYE